MIIDSPRRREQLAAVSRRLPAHVARLAWSAEMATTAAVRAISRKIERVIGVNAPWLVVTTGGVVVPDRCASRGPRTVWSWIRSTPRSCS